MTDIAVFEEMKRFVGFADADAARLKAVGPTFLTHGPGITDRFYENLAKFPATAKQIEGRVDALKATHGRWMGELFSGDYGQAYFDSRIRIGMAHVRIKLPPQYVEGVMNFLRAESLPVIQQIVSGAGEQNATYQSLLRILDLDLVVINLAYGEDRLDRVSKMTGMSRKLLENLVNFGGK